MAVLKTQSQDISVLAGQTLDVQFDCYQDDAHTLPFDLTGYTLSAVLTPPGDSGAAPITVVPNVLPTQGSVEIKQDTTGWLVGRGRWYLEATDAAGDKSYPLRGLLFVGNP